MEKLIQKIKVKQQEQRPKGLKVLFFNVESPLNTKKIIKAILKIKEKNLGLYSTSQSTKYLQQIKEQLERQGKKAFITQNSSLEDPGQVLGCNYKNLELLDNKVQAHIVISEGEFHIGGLSRKELKKPIYHLNPLTFTLEKKKFQLNPQIRKQLAKQKLKDAKVIGFIVSVKPGQNRFWSVTNFAKKLQNQGKQTAIFLCDTLNKQDLLNFYEVDLWVNTACPRIHDDLGEFNAVNLDDVYE